MAEYLSPGVYVEETSSGSSPIAGVGTSTAGFIGEVSDGVDMPLLPGKEEDPNDPKKDHYTVAEADAAQLVTSWAAFKNLFGDIQQGNKVLAHAVYGFFNNGGSRCWVTCLNDSASDANVQTALAGFESIDEIAIVAVPGCLDVDDQEMVIAHCENMGDRFAILDGQRISGDMTWENIKGEVRISNYAALYFPWIDVGEKIEGEPVYFPPSGHIAGVYARVDARRGVHKAPANEVIRGALGVETPVRKEDQDGLNPGGVNVIRPFKGAVTIWGARTLGGDANGEWKYINVRRLFLYLRESIEEGVRWVVFEPNTPELWARITRNITAFLLTVWGAGALFGGAPEQAFYVKCDEETNPPEVRDLGQVVTEIGVAPVRPAEFVIFRVSQWAGSES